MVAGDRVRLDGEAQQLEALVEVVFPDRRVPLEERLAAPDVIDEDVEAALFVRDAGDQGLDLGRDQMVGGDRDTAASAAVTSSAVSSMVSGRSYSERFPRVLRPVT